MASRRTQRKYDMFKLAFSPIDLGIPVYGTRTAIFLTLRDIVERTITLDQNAIRKLFYSVFGSRGVEKESYSEMG